MTKTKDAHLKETQTQKKKASWLFWIPVLNLLVLAVLSLAGPNELSPFIIGLGLLLAAWAFSATSLVASSVSSSWRIPMALFVGMGIPHLIGIVGAFARIGDDDKYLDIALMLINGFVAVGTFFPALAGLLHGWLSAEHAPEKSPQNHEPAVQETPTLKGHTLAHPTPFPLSSSIFLAFITFAMVLYACFPFAKGVMGATASLNSASDSFRLWAYGLMALQLLAPLTFSRLGLLLPYGCIGLGLAFNLQYGLLFEPFETSAYFNYMQFILVAHGLVATAFALPYLWPRVQSRIKVVQPWAYDALRQSVQSFEHSYLDELKPQETGLRLFHPNGSEEQRGEVDVMFAGDVDHLRLQCRFPLTPISDNPILVHPKRVGLPGLLDVARRQKTGHRILDHFFVCTGDTNAIKDLAALENTLLKLMPLNPEIRIHDDQLLIDCPFIQKDEMDWIVVLDAATALWKDLDHMGQGLGAALPQEETENKTALPKWLPSRPLGFSKNWTIAYAMILLISPLVLNHQLAEKNVYKHRISAGEEEKIRWPDPQHLRSMDDFVGRTLDVHVAPCLMLLPSAYCHGDVLPKGVKEGDVLAMGKKSGGQRNGQWTYWWRYPDIKWQEGQYEDDQPVGLWTRWDSSGALKAKTMWISHKEAMQRYPDKESRRVRSVKDGLHQEWYERGQMKLNGHFAHGKKAGLWRAWYTHGQKESEGHYEPVGNGGQKVGPWSYWDQEGKLIEEEYYRNGELVLDDAT